MSVYIRDIISEKIHEEIDREMYKKAFTLMEDDDTELVSWEEAKAEFGIPDEV